jgi:phosphatidylethanolamine/phosphatidyl-N-methylethanolamine N-methyltransferase
MHDIVEFVKAALRNPLEVSTIFPTSRQLAETLIAHADLARAGRVVELGVGTGAITKHLATRIHRESYIGVELDAKLVEYLRRQPEFNGMRFESGLAEKIGEWTAPGETDVVISSLPWTIFSPELQGRTITAILDSLKPGGVFITYICANAFLYPNARSFTNKLKSGFADVYRSPLEWRNIPPAFVLKSTKAG